MDTILIIIVLLILFGRFWRRLLRIFPLRMVAGLAYSA